MTVIYRASDLLNAHVVAGLLKTNGIDCEVRGETLLGALGELPLSDDVLPSVWLNDVAQAEQARRLIEHFEQQSALTGYWQCANCLETNEANFEICWHCGEGKTGVC